MPHREGLHIPLLNFLMGSVKFGHVQVLVIYILDDYGNKSGYIVIRSLNHKTSIGHDHSGSNEIREDCKTELCSFHIIQYSTS